MGIFNKKAARILPRNYHYRKPRVVKAKDHWFIEYWYRIPVDIRHLYDGKEWHRFRFREDINKREGPERRLYAQWLCEEINDALRNGYNPFFDETQRVEDEALGITAPEEMNAREALTLFLDKWSQRGLAVESYAKYRRFVGRLIDWLHQKNLLLKDVRKIQTHHIELFLEDQLKKRKFSNREYNNTYDFIRTAFNFLLKRKLIDDNPCTGIDKLKSKSSKHRFYDEAHLKLITTALKTADLYTYFAFQTVYYLCVRSDKELMNLKVGNITWEQNKILLEADGTKGGHGRYIPMDENIKSIFQERGIDKFPGDYYVFGIHGQPAEKPFATGFFSKRFRKVRNLAGLPDWFTLYGAKHTRIIHLKMDGLADQDIMALTGHKDFVAYAKYLRDLGLSANPAKINSVSRKI